jgi:steroid delta-isomerase-like uncharacterized protein
MLITAAKLTRRSFLNRSGNLLGGILVGMTAFPVSSSGAADSSIDKVMEEYYAAYQALDARRLLALMTEDCFFEDPTFHLSARGKAEIMKMFEPLPRAYSNMKIEVENRVTCHNWVVSQQMISANVKTGKDPDAEVKKFSVRGVTILRFRENRIDRWTDYYDYATFLKQTGFKSNV